LTASIAKGFSGWSVTIAIAALILGCGGGSEAQLDDILSLHADGRFRETIAPLRELLEATPDDPELNHLYGVTLLRSGQPQLAIWPLRKAAQTPERAIEDGLLLTTAILRGSNAEDAIDAANRVLELEPDHVDALTLLISAKQSAMKNEEVLIDVDRLLALEPDDVGALTARLVALLNLSRVDEAEQALAAIAAAVEGVEENAEWLPRLCAATATFTKEKGDVEAAEVHWNGCLEQFPAEEIIVFDGVKFFSERRQPERVNEILSLAYETKPTQMSFIEAYAHRLSVSGQEAEAERLLRAATRDGVNERQAWFTLSDYYEQRDELAKSKEALKQALVLAGEVSPTVLAGYADLLIRVGDYDEADEVIEAIGDEPVLVNLLRGRLLLARGKPAEALEAIEAGLRLWPGHSIGRWLAAQAAEQLGDYDRALAEYVEAVRGDRANKDAVFSLLRMLEALGRDHEVLPILSRYQHERPNDPDGLVKAIRIANRIGQRETLNRALTSLRRIPGQQGVAVAEVAAIQVVRGGPAAGVQSIQASRLDLTRPVSAPALRSLVDYLVADGKPNEALEAVDAAIAEHPDEAQFHELRGRALRAAGEVAPAREALNRALELEPEHTLALAELAALSAEQEDRDAAIALYDRADRADPDDPAYAWQAIQLSVANDDDAEVDRRLEELLSRHGIYAPAANLMAQRLRERDPERALVLARRAVRFRGGPEALDTLGRIQLESGDAANAAKTLSRSVKARPDSPSTQYWLGAALSAAGDEDGARQALGVALETDDFPEREAAVAKLARLNAD
jgi:tetratricopeptide (TPR) repeat protein